MFTDGKTFTDLTAIRFYMLDVSSPTIFSCTVLLTAWVGAHFPTFRIGFSAMLAKSSLCMKFFPFQGDLVKRGPRGKVVRNVNPIE